MPSITFKAPLNWPAELEPTPRNLQRSDHGFAALNMEESIGYLEQELQDAGITRATLFLDIEQPLIERLRKKVGSRTGASLHIKFQLKGYVIACDRWQQMEHNIYALHLTLRQWRSIERWGVGTMPMLLAGFETERLPEKTAAAAYAPAETKDIEPWMEALGLGPTATLDDAVAIYHRRAKQAAHDPEALLQLNIVMETVRSHFANKS